MIYKIILATLVLMFTYSSSYGESCTPIMAGQHTVAGEVCVDIVDEKLVVAYMSNENWDIIEYHLHVGDDISDIPASKNGNPKVGRFDYSGSGEQTIVLCPEDLGISDWSELDDLTIAAHCVVSNGEREETGWGKGYKLGKNWSMAFDVDICQEEYFDSDAFSDDIFGEGTLVVRYNGGNASRPYLTASVDFDQDGVYDVVSDAYCVDLANTIRPGREYCALTLSSYDESVYNLPAILYPENMDLVNYVMNNFQIGQVMSDGEVLTGGSIQQTMWRLIYTDGANPGSSGEGRSSINHIVEMMTEAFDMGEDFVPECGGYVAVVLYPVDCGDDDIAAQAIVAQALVSEFPVACDVRNVICD